MASSFQQATARPAFGFGGLSNYMPQGMNMADILTKIGVSSETLEPFKGMMPGQIKDVLSLQRQFAQMNKQAPTTETLYSDPERRAKLVLSMWKEFNSYLKSEGGTPIGLMEFIKGGGFAPDIQTMFESLFAPQTQ